MNVGESSAGISIISIYKVILLIWSFFTDSSDKAMGIFYYMSKITFITFFGLMLLHVLFASFRFIIASESVFSCNVH